MTQNYYVKAMYDLGKWLLDTAKDKDVDQQILDENKCPDLWNSSWFSREERVFMYWGKMLDGNKSSSPCI